MEQKIIVPTLSRKRVENYRIRLGRYLATMCFFKKMMDDGDLSMEDYDELERVFLEKFRMNEKSLQRTDLKSVSERDDFNRK